MNLLGNNQNIDSPLDILASLSGVMGDAPRQLVTKSVSGSPTAHSRGCRSRSLPQRFQGTDEFLVVVPASNRTLINLLPHLPGAGGDHPPLGGMELQAPWVPFETDKLQHFTRPCLLIGHQFLVRHVKNKS